MALELILCAHFVVSLILSFHGKVCAIKTNKADTQKVEDIPGINDTS